MRRNKISFGSNIASLGWTVLAGTLSIWVLSMVLNAAAVATDRRNEQLKDPDSPASLGAETQPDPELESIKRVVLKTYGGWMSRNPENSAPYFRKAPGDLFFDIWPVSTEGWDAYKKSSQQFLDTLTELKITVKDMRVERHGNVAWVLAVCDAESTSKKGEKFHVDNRYTGILVKLDGAWKIAHEHWSAPTRAGGFENW